MANDPYLELGAGPEMQRFEVANGRTLVMGRSTECDCVIPSGSVSRRHAKVVRQGADVTIEDLGSSNGTFVNGERLVGPRALRNQDRVRLGSVDLSYVVPESQPSADATIVAGSFDPLATIAVPPGAPRPELRPTGDASSRTGNTATGSLPPVPAEPPLTIAQPRREEPPPTIAQPRAEGPPATVVQPRAERPAKAEGPPPTIFAPRHDTRVEPPPPRPASQTPPPPPRAQKTPPPATIAIGRSEPTPTSFHVEARDGPSVTELAAIAGASFLVVFAIGALLIRFVF